MKNIFVDINDEKFKEEARELQKEALKNGGMLISELVKSINYDRKKETLKKTSRKVKK